MQLCRRHVLRGGGIYYITVYFQGAIIIKIKFSALKKMDVISITDGKNLGRVTDITFSSPESRVLGVTCAGARGFRFNKEEVFLPTESIVKIGEDVVLANAAPPKPVSPRPRKGSCPTADARRGFDDCE